VPETVWWLDLTDPDRHILRQIYTTGVFWSLSVRNLVNCRRMAVIWVVVRGIVTPAAIGTTLRRSTSFSVRCSITTTPDTFRRSRFSTWKRFFRRQNGCSRSTPPTRRRSPDRGHAVTRRRGRLPRTWSLTADIVPFCLSGDRDFCAIVDTFRVWFNVVDSFPCSRAGTHGSRFGRMPFPAPLMTRMLKPGSLDTSPTPLPLKVRSYLISFHHAVMSYFRWLMSRMCFR